MKTGGDLVYPEMSYVLTGILFAVHNEMGQYAREKQYGDLVADKLDENKLKYNRECQIGNSGNIMDFVIDDKIVIELKAKRMLNKGDYEQIQRYLQESQLKLGLLVNFRDKFIKPSRIIRIDTQNRTKFISPN